MGHSYGGYSTLSLIVQTTRFKAAVGSAGPADLISDYGIMDKTGSSWAIGWAETGQGEMGGTPWQFRDRYIANSPIFFLDRVHVATAGWLRQRAGREVTASVLDSGVAINLTSRPHGQLQLICAADATVVVVADENTSTRLLSPDGKSVAYARQVSIYTPKAGEALPFGTDDEKKFSLEVKSLDGSEIANAELHDSRHYQCFVALVAGRQAAGFPGLLRHAGKSASPVPSGCRAPQCA
jgi:hypothetical protein